MEIPFPLRLLQVRFAPRDQLHQGAPAPELSYTPLVSTGQNALMAMSEDTSDLGLIGCRSGARVTACAIG